MGLGFGEAGLVTECTGLTLPGGVERGVLAAPAPNRSGPSIELVAGLFFFLSPQRPTLVKLVAEKATPLLTRSSVLLELLTGVRRAISDSRGSSDGNLGLLLPGEATADLGETTLVA